MKSKKSRLALVGVLALAMTVVVGLASGSVADAKKKKGGKGGSVFVSQTSPTLIPPSTPPGPAGCQTPPAFTPCTVPGNRSFVQVPLTVGKKAKGKVVSLDSVVISYTLTGSPRTGAGTTNDVAAAASNLGLSLTAPNGRTVGVDNPGGFDENATTIGPVTVTPDSPFGVCETTEIGTDGTTTICSLNDPEDVVKPPTYAGTLGDSDMAELGGVPAKGVWSVKVRNFSTMTTGILSNVSLNIGLTQGTSSGGGKKKKK